MRYCELLLVALGAAGLEARVYNTIGLNDCPAALWQSLDLAALKTQFGALEILPNGPRFWLMDRMQSYCYIVDATLDERALAALGQRLHLPAGWSYRTRQLETELNVRAVGGEAVVVQDELRNTYQRFDS